MEILQSMYQERLDSLAKAFLTLLQQLEKTINPFNHPQLTGHRIEYLSHIITSTLEDEREKFVQKLNQQVRDLAERVEKESRILDQPMFFSKEHSRSSTCSKDSWRDSPHDKLKSLKTSSKKSSPEQSLVDGISIIDSVPSRLSKKNHNSRSETSIKLESQLSQMSRGGESEDFDFDFKYLRIGRN